MYAGAIVDTTIAGMNVSTSIGPVIDTFVGLRLGIEVAGVVEVSGPFKVELSLVYSGSFHNFKDEMKVMENNITGVKNDLTTANNEITATKNEINTVKTDLTATTTEVNANKTAISRLQMQMGGIKADAFNVIFLG
jgi:hypothetical protein